jgi:DNA polymerase III sliding clamp (beta) subunit (PCNA family)
MRNGEFSAGNHYTKDAGDFTATYNTIALREHGTPSIQRLYPTRRENITTHVAELTTEDITIEHHNSDAWVDKAALHKLTNVDDAAGRGKYLKSAGSIATDGYRLHHSPDITTRIVDWDTTSAMQFITDGRKNDNVVTLDAKAARQLIAGCKQALKIKATGIYLSVNGSLDYRATDGETEISGNINAGYAHEGADILFYINARYLLDAISLPGQITIKIKHDNAPVYITDGSHEAIVMPLHMDK